MFNSPSKEPAAAVKVLNTRSILDAAEDGCALSTAEALHLLELTKEEDLNRLRQVAETLKKRQVEDKVRYESGVSLFLTNLCEMAPILYPYPRQLGQKGAYTLTIDDIDATLELAHARQVRRVILSGGGFCSTLSIPGLEAPHALKTYTRLLGYIREKYPQMAIQGFSPDEIEFLCILNDRSERYTLELLMDHGLKALDTFGVDVLMDTVRASISPKKATVKRWLEIAAMARQLELPVIARIEAGPIERLSQRVRHFEVLRRFLEKHPGTFSKLVPQMWAKPLTQPVSTPGLAYTNHSHRLKLIAVSRLFLGSLIADQQVCWLPDQVEEAQGALSWGANDFGCTDSLAYYRFLSGQMTGFETRNGFTESEFVGLIRETGLSC